MRYLGETFEIVLEKESYSFSLYPEKISEVKVFGKYLLEISKRIMHSAALNALFVLLENTYHELHQYATTSKEQLSPTARNILISVADYIHTHKKTVLMKLKKYLQKVLCKVKEIIHTVELSIGLFFFAGYLLWTKEVSDPNEITLLGEGAYTQFKITKSPDQSPFITSVSLVTGNFYFDTISLTTFNSLKKTKLCEYLRKEFTWRRKIKISPVIIYVPNVTCEDCWKREVPVIFAWTAIVGI